MFTKMTILHHIAMLIVKLVYIIQDKITMFNFD
jgi:hypothetical protein